MTITTTITTITLENYNLILDAMYESAVKSSPKKVKAIKYSKDFTLEGSNTLISVTIKRFLKKTPFRWRNLFRKKKIIYIEHALVRIFQDNGKVMDLFYNYFQSKKTDSAAPFNQFKYVEISMGSEHKISMNH